eukprot:148-Heterococcus_DN1.PRE.1
MSVLTLAASIVYASVATSVVLYGVALRSIIGPLQAHCEQPCKILSRRYCATLVPHCTLSLAIQ